MQSSTDFSGLTSAEVEQRKLAGQTNRHEFSTSRHLVTILRSNIFTLFNGVVGVGFLLLLILGKWQDALFGLAVIANILIGIIQELRSKIILDRLSLIGRKPSRVRRNGITEKVENDQLVLNDLLEFSAGDQLAVDARVVFANNLEIDESLLTGEADPVQKNIDDLLLSGSLVVNGSGLAEVARVGADTFASKLEFEARGFTKVSSEIRESLDRLIKWISWALGPLIAIVLIGQLVTLAKPVDALVRAIASAISMVPQGLVLITSIAFAIAATKLAKRKVVVQELAAVEGLARVDLICFDKTGTLTSGQFEFDQAIELDVDQWQSLPQLENWRNILGAFATQPNANATARALKTQFPDTSIPVSSSQDFNSAQKFSSLTVAGHTWYLGAPEVLTTNAAHLEQAKTLANQGLRVLMLGVEYQQFIPVALVALREEIKVQATQTLAYFKDQSVTMKVISGDHPSTVATVARLAGLDFEGNGFDARNLPTDFGALRSIMEREHVFGRVDPAQKKQMVLAMQQSGHVVAMVGDGVNDVLAIKQADIGIAMGSGSAATRAVANLTLLDNSFDRLPKVVAEGRQVIANVERLSRLFLTKTTWAMILALVFGVLLWEFPFLPRQLSAVDGFAIGIPSFLLAFLPNQKIYQRGFLRRALAFCIPAGFATALGVIGLAIAARISGDWTVSESQTATSIFLSITGLWVLGTLSRPWSAPKVAILLGMIVLAVGMFTLPITIEFFGFSYLTESQIGITAAIGILACLLIEISNRLAQRTIARDSN